MGVYGGGIGQLVADVTEYVSERSGHVPDRNNGYRSVFDMLDVTDVKCEETQAAHPASVCLGCERFLGHEVSRETMDVSIRCWWHNGGAKPLKTIARNRAEADGAQRRMGNRASRRTARGTGDHTEISARLEVSLEARLTFLPTVSVERGEPKRMNSAAPEQREPCASCGTHRGVHPHPRMESVQICRECLEVSLEPIDYDELGFCD